MTVIHADTVVQFYLEHILQISGTAGTSLPLFLPLDFSANAVKSVLAHGKYQRICTALRRNASNTFMSCATTGKEFVVAAHEIPLYLLHAADTRPRSFAKQEEFVDLVVSLGYMQACTPYQHPAWLGSVWREVGSVRRPGAALIPALMFAVLLLLVNWALEMLHVKDSTVMDVFRLCHVAAGATASVNPFETKEAEFSL